jgi:hypothetical protein
MGHFCTFLSLHEYFILFITNFYGSWFESGFAHTEFDATLAIVNFPFSYNFILSVFNHLSIIKCQIAWIKNNTTAIQN